MGIKNNKNLILVLIVLLISVSQFGNTLYLPSIPEISYALNANKTDAELTLTLYTFGIGISQFFYGPLSDNYGRRCITIFGLTTFLIGSILTIFSQTIIILLVARLLQGLGIGVSGTLNRAIIRDLFEGNDYIRACSKIAMAIILTPVIAPILGGYLQKIFYWRASFVFIAIYSMVVLAGWLFYFQETNIYKGLSNLSLRKTTKIYYELLKNRNFMTNTLCGGIIYAGEIGFITAAPFLMKNKLNLSSVQFGWIFIYIVFGFLLGAYLSTKLAKNIKSSYLVYFGLLLNLIGSSLMLTLAFVQYISILTIMIPISIFMVGAGFVYPNTGAGALGDFSNKAGTASAMLGGLQAILASISSALMAHLHVNSVIPVSGFLLCISLIASAIYFYGINATIFFSQETIRQN